MGGRISATRRTNRVAVCLASSEGDRSDDMQAIVEPPILQHQDSQTVNGREQNGYHKILPNVSGEDNQIEQDDDVKKVPVHKMPSSRKSSGHLTHRLSQSALESRSRASMNSQEANSVVRAVSKLRELLGQLENEEVDLPERKSMAASLTYAVDLLSAVAERNSPIDEIDTNFQQLIPHDEVRAWLTSTFTTREPTYSSVSHTKPTFKAVVGTVIVGQYLRKMSEGHLFTHPPGVGELFHKQFDGWNCDIFKLEKLSNTHPLKYVAFEAFYRHGLMKEFKIPSGTFEAFITRVEDSYQLHGNPYHNCTHAADVVQTVHVFIKLAQLENWFTKLEILSLLFSAIIHDMEHTGTTNSFHVQSRSELSLCYNDQSVLENYHLNRAYNVLREDDVNIFRNLNSEQYAQVRSMSIEMVLATDMSKHFDQLKHMKRLLASSDGWNQLQRQERSKLRDLFLHMADISHPGKDWSLHHEWTERIKEEFFLQGDRERDMGLVLSPLCDRTTTAVPESQKGFIDFIVRPSFDVFGETIEMIFHKRELSGGNFKVWKVHIQDNYKQWEDKIRQRDEPVHNTTTDENSKLNGELSVDTQDNDKT